VWNKGAPQGSNLGPYQFLVMNNDLPSHLTHKLLSMFADNADFIFSLYADDVNSIISHKYYHVLEEICNYSISVFLMVGVFIIVVYGGLNIGARSWLKYMS
jgi:hypothetical protein